MEVIPSGVSFDTLAQALHRLPTAACAGHDGWDRRCRRVRNSGVWYDTLSRPCARRVLCWFAFPLVPVLGSTGSATERSALFVGFTATTTESDFSGSCLIGYGSSPFRYGPAVSNRGPNPRSPG